MSPAGPGPWQAPGPGGDPAGGGRPPAGWAEAPDAAADGPGAAAGVPGAEPAAGPGAGFATAAMAHLGLGSNLGDRAGTLAAAVAAIARRPGIAAIRCSSLYETEPQGLREQPWFLNCVLAVATTLDPAQLLAACQAVEADFGRVRDVRWGPRTLDVDILLYGERVLQTPDLTLPHPRLHERAFALLPLAEVAPTALVPGHGSVAGLLAAVAGQAVRRVGEPPPLPVGSSAPRGRPPRRAGRPAGEGAP